MHLVQTLLPLLDDTGQRFSEATFDAVRRELTERFGGVTAFVRSPAIGLWKMPSGEVNRDEIVIVEVMVDALDTEWWRRYRDELAQTFRQDDLVVRAIAVEKL